MSMSLSIQNNGVDIHDPSCCKDSLFTLKDKIIDVFDEAFDIVTLLTEFDRPEAVTSGHMLCVQPEHGDEYPLFRSRICYNGPESVQS